MFNFGYNTHVCMHAHARNFETWHDGKRLWWWVHSKQQQDPLGIKKNFNLWTSQNLYFRTVCDKDMFSLICYYFIRMKNLIDGYTLLHPLFCHLLTELYYLSPDLLLLKIRHTSAISSKRFLTFFTLITEHDHTILIWLYWVAFQ